MSERVYESTSGRLFIDSAEIFGAVREIVYARIRAAEEDRVRAMHHRALGVEPVAADWRCTVVPAGLLRFALKRTGPRPPNRAERRAALRGRRRRLRSDAVTTWRNA